MGKFDGYLLMSDFDGTLAWKGTISRENCEAIRYFQSEGGLFSICSGRFRKWLLEWQDYIQPNTWCAMLNGALICDRMGENAVVNQPMDEDFLEVASRIMQACPHLERVRLVDYDKYTEWLQGEPLSKIRVGHPGYKMVFLTPDEYSDEYTEAITALVGERYVVMRSWINGIEVQKRGTGKGEAVRHMRLLHGDRVHTVIAAGDYENDLDMIREADIGYAVGNAIASLKALADRVTVPASEHAIARIIADIEQGFPVYSCKV
ncbi:MAG: HAD-IIB family hydrolase [Clostridia bacterium]|nr:HAD-IIB family hydrolase [Clostridia bacterium]